MSYPKEYTDIYFKRSEGREVHLLFYNKENKNALVFDGLQFAYNLTAAPDEHSFTELQYSLDNKEGNFIISTIRHDWDIFFIKFENGDIFQLHFPMDDVESGQYLGVYKPGRPSYNNVLNHCNSLEEPEIPEDSSANVIDWFNRKK